MAKHQWAAGFLFAAALLGAGLLVSSTGGAASPWLLAFAPFIFLLGWYGGPWLGFWFSTLLSILLLAVVLGFAPHVPQSVLREDLIGFTILGMACPLGSLRWVRRFMRRRLKLEEMEWHEKLSDLTHCVFFSQDLETALDLVLIGLEHVVDAPGRAILMHNLSTGELRPESCMGLPEAFQGLVFSVHGTENGRYLADGNSIVCLDTSLESNTPFFSQDPGARTYVVLPLCSMDGLVAALYLSWPDKNRLNDKSIKRLEEFSDSVAFAIQRIRTEKEHEMMALTDGLTGLYNYRMLQARLREETARAARQQSSLSFLMFDLDTFKEVNDRHGHPMGDQVLRAVAQGIREGCRSGDIPVRYAGDEFAVLCPCLSLGDAVAMAERLGRTVERSIHRSTGLNITASMGVASYPETTSDPHALTEQADQALYQAKARGRSRVCHAPTLERLEAVVGAP